MKRYDRSYLSEIYLFYNDGVLAKRTQSTYSKTSQRRDPFPSPPISQDKGLQNYAIEHNGN